MTSIHSDIAHVNAVRRLRSLCKGLAGDAIVCTVDRPIDQAITVCLTQWSGRRMHVEPLDALAKFMRTVQRHVVPCPRRLSPAQSLTEALDLLESGYVTADARGCDAVWADLSVYGRDAFPFIVECLANELKRRLRQAYCSWLWVSTFTYAPFRVRCATAEILIEVYSRWLPDSLRWAPFEQLAHCIPELVQLVTAVDPSLDRISAVVADEPEAALLDDA